MRAGCTPSTDKLPLDAYELTPEPDLGIAVSNVDAAITDFCIARPDLCTTVCHEWNARYRVRRTECHVGTATAVGGGAVAE